MHIRRTAIGGTAVLAAVTALGIGTAGPATAASASFATMTTMGSICLGGVNSYVWNHGAGGVLGGQIAFDLWTPTLGQPCTVAVSVNWRNLDSGANGAFTSVVTGNGSFESRSQQFELPTGPGRVSLSLTTDRPHIPVADTEISVP
ncbi:hypothetical protein ABZ942_19365 [Nocardia sp. NPDC046473]|uniref:hypothetical protein n=1 Tax=Nocardia sp. NPDC046473 TaxID=3155733 RepID=UPI0033D110E1